MLANLIRGCLGEFGIVAPLGIRRVPELIGIIRDDTDEPEFHPSENRDDSRGGSTLRSAAAYPGDRAGDPGLASEQRASRRLATSRASALLMARPSLPPSPPRRVQVRTPLRCVPRADAKGAFDRRSSSPRSHLETGRCLYSSPPYSQWNLARSLCPRSGRFGLGEAIVGTPANPVVTVALANKAARIIWALLTRGGVYQSATPQPA